METFPFNPPINLFEEEKWLLAVTFFEATNSAFTITKENNFFSISIPGRWRLPIYLEDGIFDKLKNLIKIKSEIDIELHVRDFKKRVDKMKIGDKEYKLSVFDKSKDELLEEFKEINYHDQKDMLYRM